MNEILNVDVLFNNIPEQRLTHANQLTVNNWNDIINNIRVQTNTMALYIKRFDNWFFDTTNPNSWFNFVDGTIRNVNAMVDAKLDIGSDDDSANTLSYHGLKNYVDTCKQELLNTMQSIDERLQVEEGPTDEVVYYGNLPPDTDKYRIWISDYDESTGQDASNVYNRNLSFNVVDNTTDINDISDTQTASSSVTGTFDVIDNTQNT